MTGSYFTTASSEAPSMSFRGRVNILLFFLGTAVFVIKSESVAGWWASVVRAVAFEKV